MKYLAVFHPSSELYGADRIMVVATKVLQDYIPVIYIPSHGELNNFIHKEIPQAIVKVVPNMPVISRSLFTPKGCLSVLQKFRFFKDYIKEEHKEYRFKRFYVNTLACSFILPLLKKHNVKTIAHVHEILENPRIIALLSFRTVFHFSDLVVCVSKAVETNSHKWAANKKTFKSKVIHNGINPMLTQVKESSNQLNFYLFGRINPLKGQWYLIEALSKIPKHKLKNVKFHLIGSALRGHEFLEKELQQEIINHNLTDYVVHKPFMSNITPELSKADICLVPSLVKDSFPTTVLEAMSAGKVVIASNTGGAKEAITNGVDGFIIPPDDAVLFSEIIIKLIENPALVQEMGKAAFNTFHNRFTIQNFKEKWVAAIA